MTALTHESHCPGADEEEEEVDKVEERKGEEDEDVDEVQIKTFLFILHKWTKIW